MRVRSTTVLFAAVVATAALAASDTHTLLLSFASQVTLSSGVEISNVSGTQALRFKTATNAGNWSPGGWQNGTDWEGRLTKPNSTGLSPERCLSASNNTWATAATPTLRINNGRTYIMGPTTISDSGTQRVSAFASGTAIDVPSTQFQTGVTGIRFLTMGTHPGTTGGPTPQSYVVRFTYADATFADVTVGPIAMVSSTTARVANASSPAGTWTTTPWAAQHDASNNPVNVTAVNSATCGNSAGTGRDIVWVANPHTNRTLASVRFTYTQTQGTTTTSYLGGPIALSIDTTEDSYRTAFNFADEGTLLSPPVVAEALVALRNGIAAQAWWYGVQIAGTVTSPDSAELRFRCSEEDWVPGGGQTTIPENKWQPWSTAYFTVQPSLTATFGAQACRGAYLQYEVRVSRPENGSPAITSVQAFYDLDEDRDLNTVEDLWRPGSSTAGDGTQADCDDLAAGVNGPDPYWHDDDGDTWGDPADEVGFCPGENPPEYVSNDFDCDDGNADVALVDVPWYPDVDEDGLGGDAPVITDCAEPLPRGSHVLNTDDCNDDLAEVGEVPLDWFRDGDGDGLGDLADTANVTCFPLAGEVIDNTDCNDADATIGANPVTWYADADLDGLGGTSPTQLACTQPATYVRTSTDCNDTDGTIGLAPGVPWYRDQDGDNFGTPTTTQTACTRPTGYVRNNTDCDDNPTDDVAPRVAAARIYPGATLYEDSDRDGYGGATLPASSLCREPTNTQSVDNTDCDDGDAAEKPGVSWYRDADGDGFGATTATAALCSRAQPTDVSNNTDCDDDASNNTVRDRANLVYPGASYYADADGDLYGAGTATTPSGCGLPTGFSVRGDDCDDNAADDVAPRTQAALIFPGSTLYVDSDSDGYGSTTTVAAAPTCRTPTTTQSVVSTDCDDTDAAEKPGVNWYRDADGDTFGATGSTPTACARSQASDVSNNTDCDDDASDNTVRNQAALIFPGARYYTDADGDQYGAGAGAIATCALPAGSSVRSTDCDDTNASIFPGASYYPDTDNDTYGAGSPISGACAVPTGYAWRTGDCDDNAADDTVANRAARVHPGATYYADSDRDQYGDPASPITLSANTCRVPTNTESVDNTDCSPTNDAIYPGATYYRDLDGDSYGRASSGTSQAPGQCVVPTGYSASGADCDDNDAEALFSARQWFRDDDKDTFGGVLWVNQCARPTSGSGDTLLRGVTNSSDCDDTPNDDAPPRQRARLVYPGAPLYQDIDGDGYGKNRLANSTTCRRPDNTQSVDSTDCDDNDATEKPGVLWYRDVDGDTYGDPGTTARECERLVATDSTNSTDCNDNPATDSIRVVASKIYPGATYFLDQDADQYGSTTSTTPGSCGLPAGYSVRNDDCDDQDATEKPGVSWYPDADGDTYGDALSAPSACTRVRASDQANNADCDDNTSDDRVGAEADRIFPGASYWRDADRDGFGAGTELAGDACALPADASTNNQDCDDDATNDVPREQAALIFPGASYFADSDGDGYGAGAPIPAEACALPRGQSVLGTDCDDNAANDSFGFQAAQIFPGATYWRDSDGDNFGDAAAATTPTSCGQPVGFVTNDDDCDDRDDEARDRNSTRAWWEDRDGDDFGDPARTKQSCIRGGSWVTNDDDCDDDGADDLPNEQASLIHPGATYYLDADGDSRGDAGSTSDGGCELPDGYSVWSDDCDDDDVEATHVPRPWYRDFDGDQFGTMLVRIDACVRPLDADNGNPYVTDFTDCRDDVATANPASPEVPGNDVDDDCDARTVCFLDADKDGFGHFTNLIDDQDGDGACQTTRNKEADDNEDCDDQAGRIHPDASEVQGDGVDQDCSCLYLDDPSPRDGIPANDFGFGCGGPDEDDDGDALTWREEQDCGSADDAVDTDGDNVTDPVECEIGTLAAEADSDGDGLTDDLEIGVDQYNPRDFDGDGTWDVFDPDDDDDGLPTADELTAAGEATDRDGDLAGCATAAGDFLWVPADISDACGPDHLDTDDDNDGLPTHQELDLAASTPDDGDGDPAWWDDDTDGDSFPDRDESAVDSDGDGRADFIDPDSDDDRVADADERHADTDNDDTEDRLDADDDNDRVPTELEVALELGLPSPTGSPLDLDSDNDATPDFLDNDDDDDGQRTRTEDTNGSSDWFDDDLDLDGIPNFRDSDDDGDDIPTIVEADRADADNDGDPNWLDTDADDDGWDDIVERDIDTDGDTVPDWADVDSDADEVFDAEELDADSDNDDRDNRVDDDDDGDGIPTRRELAFGPADACPSTSPDVVCDDIPNFLDTDSDGDGYDDVVEGDVATDLDASPDFVDGDADNDFWPDRREQRADTDGDLRDDRVDNDDDGDTILTRDEIDRLVPASLDFDRDTTPDHLDADDDNDGVPTRYEEAQDINHIDMRLNTDADNDTIPDGVEWGPDFANPRNTDRDNLIDALDNDDDNDGIATALEGVWNLDGPGQDCGDAGEPDEVPAYLDLDSDGDGFNDGPADSFENDGDGDGISDHSDCDSTGCVGDSDGDSISNCDERDLGLDALNVDSDGDGVGDRYEVIDPRAAADTDGDRIIDALDTDDDGDGFSTRRETGHCADGLQPLADLLCRDGSAPVFQAPPEVEKNSDAFIAAAWPRNPDATPDRLDSDDDGDGRLTRDEGEGDDDGDLRPNYLDPDDFDGPMADADADGITNEAEALLGTNPLSADSDGDGLPDGVELADGGADSDGDDLIDALDPDDDNDGIPTAEEGASDGDGDGIPAWADPDADGDGSADLDETGDVDCDGIPNAQDAFDADGPCLTPDPEKPPATTPPPAVCGCSNAGGALPLAPLLALLLTVRRRRAA